MPTTARGPHGRPAARRALALAALLGLLLALPLADGPAGTPTAAAAPATPGWRLLFSDDFGGGSVDRGRWATYDGPYAGPSGNYWRPDDVLVSGGKLRIRIQRRSYGGRTYTSGGVSNYSVAQTYGRYEFRARVPRGKGIDSYGTLWPKQNGDANATLVEILAPGPETAHLTNAYGSGRSGRTVSGRFSDAFHTYTIEWAPSRFRILYDGVQWLSDSHVSRVPKSFGLAVGSGDALTGTPDASTSLPAYFEIDWVRVYRYDPSAAAAPLATARPAPTTSAPKPRQPATSTERPGGRRTGAEEPAVAGGAVPATTVLALDGDPAAQRRAAPRGLPLLAGGVAVLGLASTLLAWRRRQARR